MKIKQLKPIRSPHKTNRQSKQNLFETKISEYMNYAFIALG